MARPIWKGPFVHPSLIKKVEKQKEGIKEEKSSISAPVVVNEFIIKLYIIVQSHLSHHPEPLDKGGGNQMFCSARARGVEGVTTTQHMHDL